MREELGTEIASTPDLERVRRRKVFPLRSSSTDSTMTGSLRESSFKMGCMAMRSRSGVVSFGWGCTSVREAQPMADAVMAAVVDWRKGLREVGIGEMLTVGGVAEGMV